MIFCELDAVTVMFGFAIMEFSGSDSAFWIIEFAVWETGILKGLPVCIGFYFYVG